MNGVIYYDKKRHIQRIFEPQNPDEWAQKIEDEMGRDFLHLLEQNGIIKSQRTVSSVANK